MVLAYGSYFFEFIRTCEWLEHDKNWEYESEILSRTWDKSIVQTNLLDLYHSRCVMITTTILTSTLI